MAEDYATLRQACWEARVILGFDNDGDPTPVAMMHPTMAELVLRDAREARKDYDEVCAELEALRKRCEAVEVALQKVADWELPETGEFWPSGVKVSYEANWGSSGVRDYFRHLARQAIAAAQEPSHG